MGTSVFYPNIFINNVKTKIILHTKNIYRSSKYFYIWKNYIYDPYINQNISFFLKKLIKKIYIYFLQSYYIFKINTRNT